MKTFIKSAGLLALCAPVMFSCNNDLEGVSSGNKVPVELSLLINGVNTRTTPSLGTGHLIETAWASGDVVGLFSGTSHGVYTTSDGSTWSATTVLKVEENQEHTFYGYYPYAASNVNTAEIDCSVMADQSTAANFAASDVLRGVATNTNNGATVSMTINQVNSLIRINISGTNATSDVQATLKNVKTSGSFVLSSGAVTSETVGDVKMYRIEADATNKEYTFIAVIPAQTIATGTKFVEISSNGQTYSFAHTADVTVDSGDLQPIGITVGSQLASMEIDGNFTIGSWTPKDEITGDAEVVVPEPKQLITAAYPTGTWPTAGLAASATDWFRNGGVTVEVNENNEVSLTTGASVAWYNGYIAYRLTGIKQGDKYELKFTVAGTEGQSNNISIGLKSVYESTINGGTASSNNWMAPIAKDNGTPTPMRSETNISTAGIELTYQVTFSGLFNSSGSPATTVEEGDELEEAIGAMSLFISNTVANSTVKISNITFTEILD